jgi:DHA1 family bicyclomycin/chloramphenicol resistance-like MFS transporter
LLAGVAAYAVASLLCAAAPDMRSLLALRLVQGVAGAAGIVIARAVVRDLYTVGAARILALLLLISGFAPVIAPVIGAQLLLVTSWRGVFAALALLGGVLLCAAFLGVPETWPADRRRRGGLAATYGIIGRLVLDRSFMGPALCGGLVFGALFAYISASPFVLQTGYGLSPQAFSAVFAANALGIAAGSLLSASLVRTVIPARLLAAGVLGTGAAGLLLLAATLAGSRLPAVLAALFAVTVGVGLVLPNAAALALADHPDEAGAASALLGLTQYAIGSAAAPFAGLSPGGTGVAMAAVIAVLGVAAVAFLPRRRPATYGW